MYESRTLRLVPAGAVSVLHIHGHPKEKQYLDVCWMSDGLVTHLHSAFPTACTALGRPPSWAEGGGGQRSLKAILGISHWQDPAASSNAATRA